MQAKGAEKKMCCDKVKKLKSEKPKPKGFEEIDNDEQNVLAAFAELQSEERFQGSKAAREVKELVESFRKQCVLERSSLKMMGIVFSQESYNNVIESFSQDV